MDGSDCFFKALSAKGLDQKRKKKGWKKVGKPIVIWRSKKPRCFRLAIAAGKLAEFSHFDDFKS